LTLEEVAVAVLRERKGACREGCQQRHDARVGLDLFPDDQRDDDDDYEEEEKSAVREDEL